MKGRPLTEEEKRKIVKLLAAGRGVEETADEVKVSVTTVRRVREERIDEIPTTEAETQGVRPGWKEEWEYERQKILAAGIMASMR
jgi:DNA invertase Pin-like site-specific DNA recombinase